MSKQRLQMQLSSTQSMVDEAVYFLREHEPPEGYFLGFSGGKDSICLIELAKISGVKYTPYYSATGIDPPEVVKFIRINYPEVIWLKPKYSFWNGIYKNAPPMQMQRWCCTVLKKNPSKNINLKNRLFGIRSEESRQRAERPMVDYNIKTKINIYKPLFNFKEWHVWDFIEGNNIKYPDLYDEGFSRIGCVVCPFIVGKKEILRLSKERWPKYYKTFEHACWRWHKDKRHDGSTFEEYMDGWYMGFK